MLFVQATFLVFFAIVFLIYWSLPKLTLRKLFLLAASYVFYAAWDVRFLTLIIGCTLVNYWLGSLISTAQNRRTQKSVLAAGSLTIQAPIEACLSGLAVIHWIFYRFPVEELVKALPRAAFAGGMGLAAALAIGLLPIGYSPFIYFQF